LEQRVKELHREFCGYRSTLRHLPIPFHEALLASWFINLSQKKVSCGKTEIETFDQI